MRRLLPLFVLLLLASPTRAGDGCRFDEINEWNPTGYIGCERYGEGIASMWGGPGVATNSCIYPWRDCQTVAVQSLDTGIIVILTPSMFCGCWVNGVGPNGETERLIDLDPAAVAALGLDPADGLFRVRVWAVREGASSAVLPDTSYAR